MRFGEQPVGERRRLVVHGAREVRAPKGGISSCISLQISSSPTLLGAVEHATSLSDPCTSSRYHLTNILPPLRFNGTKLLPGAAFDGVIAPSFVDPNI